jgi:hypothetical protein
VSIYSRAPVSYDSDIRGLPRPEKTMENQGHKRFISFKTRARRERAVIWWNPAAQTRPIFGLSSFVPVPTLKCQNPFPEREKVHCKCTMWYTVHVMITLFSVGNALLCVIYQLDFTVCMYVTRISYIYIYIYICNTCVCVNILHNVNCV